MANITNPNTSTEVLVKVFDPQTISLTANPDTSDEVLTAVYDETNEALRVNIIGYNSGGSGLWEEGDGENSAKLISQNCSTPGTNAVAIGDNTLAGVTTIISVEYNVEDESDECKIFVDNSTIPSPSPTYIYGLKDGETEYTQYTITSITDNGDGTSYILTTLCGGSKLKVIVKYMWAEAAIGTNNDFSIGLNTEAIGGNSFSMGKNTKVNGKNSFVGGEGVYSSGVKAFFEGIPPGCSTSIRIEADNIGVDGNSIHFNGDGTHDIDYILNHWNTNNPSNTATLINGDGTQVVSNKTQFELSGGVDSGTLKVINEGETSFVFTSNNRIQSGVFSTDISNPTLYSVVLGGKDNKIIDGENSSIIGGKNNINYTIGGVILGGSDNSIDKYNIYSSIIGGNGNEIHNAGGGSTYPGCSIIGGKNNIMYKQYQSTIIGGNGNNIDINGYSNFIGGGQGNTIGIDTANSSIIGGSNQTLSRDNVVMVPELEISTDGGNIRLTTPDGTNQYDITIDNAGNIVSTLVV